MDSVTTQDQSSPVRVHARIVLAGIGFGLLVGGTLLGLYSRFFTSTIALRDLSNAPQVVGLPERFGVVAAIAGTVLIAVTLMGFVHGRMARTYPENEIEIPHELFIAAATVAVVLGYVWVDGLFGKYDYLRASFPYFPRLPTAAAAVGLVAAGGVLVLALLHRMRAARQGSYRTIAVAVVGGLLISMGVAVAAVRAGDDQANVDHVTADSVAVPPIPDRLGSEQYRVQVPGALLSTNFRPDIAAAGTGFVVATESGLTAYDGATGTERWHYRRTSQHGGDVLRYARGSLRSADGGAVVMAAWSEVGHIALDAITGQVLWTDSDFTRDLAADTRDPGARDTAKQQSLPNPLLITDGVGITRYDARTGARAWSTTIDSSKCPGLDLNPAEREDTYVATERGIYHQQRCRDSELSWFQITVLDTDLGTVLGIRDVAHGPPRGNDIPVAYMRRVSNTVAVRWWVGKDSACLLVDSPSRLATVRVWESDTPIAADPDGPQVAVTTSSPESAHVVDIGTETVAYQLPGLIEETWDDVHPAAFLRSEIIDVTNNLGADRRMAVRSWSRADGRPVAAYPVEQDSGRDRKIRVLPVAGAVLVICEDHARNGSTTTIIGYTPQR